MPPELVFAPDDLLLHDQGPSVMQHERQRRVIQTYGGLLTAILTD